MDGTSSPGKLRKPAAIGMYSTKSRAPSASIDTFGHIVPYEPSEYKKVDAAIRSARKGKQMSECVWWPTWRQSKQSCRP